MGTRIAWLLLTALLAGAALADSTVYKWIDKDGNAHYGSVPQVQNAQPLAIINTADRPLPSAASSATAASADQALTQGMPADSPACKSARETLGRYLQAEYLYTRGPDGQQQKLSKEEQQRATADARNAVTRSCPPQEPQP